MVTLFFFENLISQTGGVLFEDNQEAEAGAEGEEEVVVVATIEAILILGRTWLAMMMMT